MNGRIKKLPRRVMGVLLAGSFILSCTGCSYSKECVITPTDDATNISFSWWGTDVRHEYTMNGIEEFTRMNPNISIDMNYGEWDGFEHRNQMAMLSNMESDVMQINFAWLSQYSKDGNGYYNLYDLSDEINLDTYDKDDLSYGIIDGKLNAVPIAFNTYTFYYNKSVYDQYGANIPSTWDELVDAAKVLREHDVYPLGMAKKQLFLMLIAHFEQETGRHFFSEDGQLLASEEDIEDILKFYKMLFDEKVICPIDSFDRNSYMSGTVAGVLSWISDTSKYADSIESTGAKVALGDNLVTEDCKLQGWYVKPATMYAIKKDTEHPKEAAEFLNFLINSEEMADLQRTEKGIPASKRQVDYLVRQGKIESFEYDATCKMRENIDSYDTMIPIMENEDIIAAFKIDADEYLYGKLTKEECSQRILMDIKVIIERSQHV